MTRIFKTHKIKQIRKALEDGNLLGVAVRKAGIRSSETLFRWRKETRCDRLNKLIILAIDRGQQRRDDIVEDAQFKRLMEGKANGSEYEFYLTNRRPDRWKKTTEFAPSNSGAPVLKERPIIQYIAVHVGTADGNGNGNGKHTIEHRTVEHA